MHNTEGVLLGTVSKPHGLKGGLKIIVNSEAAKKIVTDNPLFIEIDGQRVPFFIEDLIKLADDHIVVKLEFIDSIEEARRYSSCKIFHEYSRNSEPDVSYLEGLIGYTAIDEEKDFHGRITDFLDQNQNRILIINFSGQEVMVPVADEVILSVDHSKKIILLHLPDGLINLNQE